MNVKHKAAQQSERNAHGSAASRAMPAGRLVLRHLLAGLISAGISCAVMSVVVTGIAALAGGKGIMAYHPATNGTVITSPDAGGRILIMAFWITVGASMAGTLVGFGRKYPERVLGRFMSLILAVLAGPLFGAVLYGFFLFQGWPVYDGRPSSVWLPLVTGVIFGIIGWGNIIGWLSAKTVKFKDGPPP